VKVRPLPLIVVALAALIAGCLGPAATPTAAPPQPLTVGLGYIPSVQFAQFYRAQQEGYYSEAGLEVTFQHRIDPDLIPLVGQGAVDIGLADGTSVIPAVAQQIPVRYGATIYARFPSVVVATADSGIDSVSDLRGRRLGIPCRCGSSWIMLQALLASADLTPDDLEIVLYPDFGQVVALREDQVDAATGFANNEPVQLALAGIEPVVLRVDEITPLPGPGLITGVSTLSEKSEPLQAFVAATLRAMQEIEDDPEVGLESSIAEVPELAEDRDTQLAILRATVEMWRSPYTAQHGFGAIDEQAWTQSIEFMRTLPETTLPQDLTADQLVTEELIR
jgi:NitT/TauT family transport system substrate-binding protein